jgi:FKBP-type peptidyl-prolyl cis-trans isomerase FklB
VIVRTRGLSFLIASAAAAGTVALGAQPQAGSPHSPSPRVTPALKLKGSYSLGVLLGTQLRRLGLSEHSIAMDQVTRGLRGVLNGSAKATAADTQNVQDFILATRAAIASKNQAAARKFLAANAKRKGVITTPSGLQYRIVRPGSGASPRPTDAVTVNYSGSLLDGEVFDSSYRRGMPATIFIDHMIKGWQEALMMMKPGAEWELFVPPQLAYGDNSPPPIPPGSLLEFKVELLSVKPAVGAPGGAVPSLGGGAQ